MPDAPQVPAVRRFGSFEIHLQSGELRKNGVRFRLSGQPFQVLVALVERPGEMVAREELHSKLWPADTFVDFDHGLNNAVARIREVLDDSSDTPRYVETVPRRGYRFIAPLNLAPFPPEAAIVEATKPPSDSGRLSQPHRLRLWPLLAGATLVAVTVMGWTWRMPMASILHPRTPVIHSLAVLPLENLSGDSSQEYFADGMTDALITNLAQIGTLRVVSRTSVMRYKASRKALPDIARELGVDGIVEGTVLRSGGRVRITSQLIYAPSDQHLWAHSYERDIRDVVSLQGEVAQAIAGEVRAAISPEQRERFSAEATVNPKAYEAYLKGRYFWNKRTQEGLQKAMEYFQQAVDQDPSYAPAYSGLADTCFPLINWGWLSTREAIPKAKAAALKAVELDERLAEAHVSLGIVKFAFDWDWPEAGRHFERALALNPAYPPAHVWHSDYLLVFGRPDEALAEMKRTVDLDPVSPELSHHMAWQLGVIGRRDEAIAQELKTLEMDPGFPPAHAVLASAYAGKGMFPEALAEAEKISALSPDSNVAISTRAYIHARSGERSRALQGLEVLKALSKRKYVPSYDFALLYLRLGDQDQAYRWLEKAYEERSSYLPWLKVNVAWAPVRDDPRFKDLLHRVGLD
jgi:TolB-like protein/DNA-binding winged helix-turn-helix (wHTH) protein/Tfp pilus assembly protein PilF